MNITPRSLKKEYYLNGGGIEAASELIDQQLLRRKTERQNRLRIRLSLEENLLRFRDHFGEEHSFVLTITHHFRRISFQIEVAGEAYNPLSKVENDLHDWSGELLTSIGMAPRFSTQNDVNVLRISLKTEQINPALRFAIALCLGILTGLILNGVLNSHQTMVLTNLTEEPIVQLLYDILNLISGPVIFFMVLSTVTGFARNSGKGASFVWVLLRFFILSAAFAAAAGAVTIWILQVHIQPDVMSQTTVREVLEYIFDIIPEDFFESFISANTPQLILLAFVIGAAMNVLKEQTTTLKKVVDQINAVGLHITEWISYTIPVFVFVLVAIQIIEHKQNDLIHLWIPLAISIPIAGLCMIFAVIYTAGRKHVSVKKLFRKLWPPFLETLKTGSVSDSFGLTEKSCHIGLGIEKSFAMTSLSHGMILYMPGSIISIVIFCIFAMAATGQSITWLRFGALIILAIILCIAAPPVPGVDMLVYMGIFSILQMRLEVLIPAIVYDMIFGILAGAMNQLLLQIEMIHHADKVGLLNHRLLQK